ncbi:hypothetical protein UACE39S_05790 [Ureibacillus acetophenoni]
MFNIWINKSEDDNESFQNNIENFLLFNLFDKNNKSNVKTDVEQLWRRFSCQSLNNVAEDFLIIAMSVFCADKRLPRRKSIDNWTRNIKVFIPVLEEEKWNSVKDELQRTISFLSGDNWVFEFRKTTFRFRTNKKNTNYKVLNKQQFDSVSLFSGGLDSFCGAINLCEQKKNTCLVGFREYNLLTSRQNELFNAIDKAYPIINKELILFNVNPFAPIQLGKERIALSAESTSRSRSLLFLAGAVAIASILGKNTPVYIPENGFIGINVPLTDSRNGSCSTRTTHPIFIKSINKILHQVGLCHEISNFYWDKSKGEILAEHIEKPVFNKYAHRTLSCSHPCLSRYDKKKDPTIEVPCNCGYCYPCIIRRASFIVNGKDDTRYNDLYKLDKEFLMNYSSLQGRSSDLRAVLFSIRRFYQNKNDEGYIRDLLVRQGGLSSTEIIAYGRVYRKSMEELISLIRYLDLNNKGKLISYLGIEGLVGNA